MNLSLDKVTGIILANYIPYYRIVIVVEGGIAIWKTAVKK